MSHNLLEFSDEYNPKQFSGVMCLVLTVRTFTIPGTASASQLSQTPCQNNEVVKMQSVQLTVQDPHLALGVCMCHRVDMPKE